MKIALIGTHGVGKTTLCFDLAARLKRLDHTVDLVKEVARECPLPINRDTTLAAQEWILHTQCARELAASQGNEMVVCDRSILDNYAYLVHSAGRRPGIEAWMREWLPSYGALFKVPIWQDPTFDGTRDTGVDFQRAIDSALDELVNEFDVKVYPLSPGHPNGWVAEILKRLGLPEVPTQGKLFT